MWPVRSPRCVTTDPVAVSFGRTVWPHADDEPITRTVTYRNSGDAAVTLNLALQVTGPNNAPAPAGMFQASAATVTVPAGGTAQVSVTADTSVESADGYWTGRLLATAGSTSVITALAVYKEAESYDLTLTHKDATGAAANDYLAFAVGLDEWHPVMAYDETGTATVRLPKGRYGLTSWVWTVRGESATTAALAQPELRLTRDTTVTLDARQTSPVVMTVPDKSAVPALVDVGHTFYTADGISVFDVLADSFAEVTVGQLGPAVPASQFSSMVASQWGKPDAEGRFGNSPYLYALSEVVPGRMPIGFARHYRNRDLATVRHDFRGVAPGGSALRLAFAEHDLDVGGWSIGLPIAMPGQRVEYYNTNGVRWRTELWMGSPDEDGWLELQAGLVSPGNRYQAGRQYRDVWNEAPLGPAFPDFGRASVRGSSETATCCWPMR